MSAEEVAKYRVMADLYRRQRRKIEKLEQALRIQTEADKLFDQENEDVFGLVRTNRIRLS